MALRPLPAAPDVARALLRLPAEDYELARRIAERHGRSINFVLARLVEHGVNLDRAALRELLGPERV